MKKSLKLTAKFSLMENRKKLYFSLGVIGFVLSYPIFVDLNGDTHPSKPEVTNHVPAPLNFLNAKAHLNSGKY